MKMNKWLMGYIACMAIMTGYMTLDTFVLKEVYEPDATAVNMEIFETPDGENALEEETKILTGESEEEDRDAENSREERAGAGNKAKGFAGGDKKKPKNQKNATLKKDTGLSGKETDTETAGKETDTERSDKKTDTETADKGTDKETAVKKTNAEASVKEADSQASVIEKSEDKSGVTITRYRYCDTDVNVADVTLSTAADLRTAFADGTYGKNITATTSETAEDNNALFAVNGDFYGARQNGYVIRNGILYRNSGSDSDVLCIYADGSMEIVSPSEYTAEELIEKGVWQAFSFGPGLLENGEITVSVSEETGRAMASNPRTAIGVIENNHYIFVVSDGRTSESEGLSLYNLASFMKELGVKTAYNLDGGGSSTMFYNGEIINNPTTNGNSIKERNVSDIIYIAKEK